MTTKSLPGNPLEIAEIRSIISQFLADDPPTLFSCILVSRSWSVDFLPRLWHSIRFDHHLSNLITPIHFQNYQHLVRQLYINDPIFLLGGFFSGSCNNLIRLEYAPHLIPSLDDLTSRGYVYSSLDESGDHVEPFQADIFKWLYILVEQQNALLHLEVDWNISPMRSWTPMGCQKLTTLHLTNWTSTTYNLNIMIAYCPSLWSLSMRYCMVTRQDPRAGNSLASLCQSEAQLQLQPQSNQYRLKRFSSPVYNRFREDSTILDFGTIRTLLLEQFYLRGEPIQIIGQDVEVLDIDTHTLLYEQALYKHMTHYVERDFSWWFPNVSSLKFTGRGESILGTDIGRFIDSVISPPATFMEDRSLEKLPKDTEDFRFCFPPRDRTHPFSEITLNSCHVSSGMIKTVCFQYGKTISVIDLEGCLGLASKDVGQIVVYCERLKVLRGPETFFWAQDLTDSGWTSNVFHELVVLLGILKLPDSDEETYKEQSDISTVDMILSQDSTKKSLDFIYGMLSQQYELEVLDLSGAIDFHLGDYCQKGIPLVLKAGLDKLRVLKNIRRVIVTGWEQEMSQEEAYWMKTHWPKLEYIHSREGGTSQGWRQFRKTLDLPVKINKAKK